MDFQLIAQLKLLWRNQPRSKTVRNFPFALRLHWDISAKSKKDHLPKKVLLHLSELLEDLFRALGSQRNSKRVGIDLYGGCFNIGKMRRR